MKNQCGCYGYKQRNRLQQSNVSDMCDNLEDTPLGWSSNFVSSMKQIWANYLTSISPEIIRKP